MTSLHMTPKQATHHIPRNKDSSFHAEGSYVFIEYSGDDAEPYCHLVYRCANPDAARLMVMGINSWIDYIVKNQH